MCVTIITLPKILSAPQTAKTSWLGTSSSSILATPETGRFVLVKTSQEKNQQKKKLKHLIQGLTAVVEKQKKEKILLLLVMVNGSSCNGCLAEFCAPAQKETVEAPVASVGRSVVS